MKNSFSFFSVDLVCELLISAVVTFWLFWRQTWRYVRCQWNWFNLKVKEKPQSALTLRQVRKKMKTVLKYSPNCILKLEWLEIQAFFLEPVLFVILSRDQRILIVKNKRWNPFSCVRCFGNWFNLRTNPNDTYHRSSSAKRNSAIF